MQIISTLFPSMRTVYRPPLDAHTCTHILFPLWEVLVRGSSGCRQSKNVLSSPLQSVDQLEVAAGDVSASSTTLLRIVEAISGDGKTPEAAGTHVITVTVYIPLYIYTMEYIYPTVLRMGCFQILPLGKWTW